MEQPPSVVSLSTRLHHADMQMHAFSLKTKAKVKKKRKKDLKRKKTTTTTKKELGNV